MPSSIVRWEEFVQRVRRHRPSELLPAIASSNNAVAPEGWLPGSRERLVLPWALACAARESIRVGNEHRDPGVTAQDVREICHKYNNLYDPLYDNHDVLSYLIRIAYEQFPFQESVFFGMARSRLLFAKPSSRATAKLRFVGEAFWEEVLGLRLDLLFAAGMLFGVGALKNEGRFDLGWYGQPNFARVRNLMAEEEARAAMEQLFSATQDDIRGMCRSAQRGLERVSFNPLIARPFVRFSDSVFVAPVPAFVFWRASAPALYYLALERLSEEDKSRFTDDLGALFEDYVVRQGEQLLDSSPVPVTVYPEIEYRQGAFTTDAILVFPDFVLLVEAKATRLTEGSRMGGPRLLDEVQRTVGNGLRQIEATASLIAERAAALELIPADRPVYGVIVTLEPYHVVDLVRDGLAGDAPTVPTAVASISDFERLVADCSSRPMREADIAERVTADRATWDIVGLVSSSGDERFSNKMLDDEWADLTSSLAPEVEELF